MKVSSFIAFGHSYQLEKDRSVLNEFQKEAVARYKLIGGNIRFILSENKTTEIIKREIINAVNKLSPEMMRNIGDLDISGTVPSLCYTIKPIDQKGHLGINL